MALYHSANGATEVFKDMTRLDVPTSRAGINKSRGLKTSGKARIAPKQTSKIIIDRYIINEMKLLGTGSYSFVYEATDTITNEIVVTKLTSLNDKNRLQCYQNELMAFKKLGVCGHPNIVRCYDDYVQDQVGVLVLEKLSPITLESYLVEKGRMGYITALEFFKDIVSAVEALHNSSISPRDLKPENIAFDHRLKKLKLFDLGLATVIRKDKTGQVPLITSTTGTPLFMAPEVMALKPHNSYLHDIWGLGMILYSMVVGHSAFHNLTTLDELREEVLVYRKINYPSWLDLNVVALLQSMLDWNPENRLSIPEIKKIVNEILSIE
jgi:BR serine/threonine kinase